MPVLVVGMGLFTGSHLNPYGVAALAAGCVAVSNGPLGSVVWRLVPLGQNCLASRRWKPVKSPMPRVRCVTPMGRGRQSPALRVGIFYFLRHLKQPKKGSKSLVGHFSDRLP